jgi:long-chain fatty acid transport protein
MRKVFYTLGVSLLLGGFILAGGFSIYEFGARASALGGAVVAQSADASTIFYNPAGLINLEGTQFYGNLTLIWPTANFVGAAPVFDATIHEAKKQMFTPIGIYFSHKFTDQLAAGISVTNPFGLGLSWEDDFPGNAISKNTELQSFYISAVASYQLMPNLSVGAGPDFVITKVTMEQDALLFNRTNAGEAKLEGTSKLAIGFSLGLQYQMEKLRLGALYRHSIENKFEEGDVTFVRNTFSDPVIQAIVNANMYDQKAKTSISYPAFASIGAHYQLMEALGVELDVMWYQWSIFDELVLEFDNENLDKTIPEDYKDSWQVRVGAEYKFQELWALRLGYIYDPTPQPIESVSPMLPDDDRHDFSIGLGYTLNNMQFDAGYMLVNIGERSTVEDGVGKNHYGFNGTYNSIAQLAFISFGINF